MESLQTGGANAPNNFETFFDLCVWTKNLLEYIIGRLIKIKVTLGIF